jgi:hypothetical protein
MPYYISPVIGSGTRDDPYRPAIAAVATAWAALIPTLTVGTPAQTWSLVQATVPATATLPPSVIALPDVSLSTPISLLSADQQLAVQQALQAAKVTVSASATVGDVIVALGQKLVPSFDLGRLVAR